MAVQVTMRSQLATNLKALAQAHGWMDASSMMAVAQSARSEDEAIATANELRQAKYSQQRSNMHLVFDDGRLQERPSLGMALQRYLQGAIGPLPVASDDPMRVQQMLIDKGYGAGPANGIWTPAWQGQMYKWRDHELESQLHGNKAGSVDQNTVERWLRSTLPVAAYDATIGFVKGIPNDLRNLAADALGMAAGALEYVGAGSMMPDPSQFDADFMRTPEQRQQDATRRRFEVQASVYNAAPWGQDTTPQEAAMRWGRDPAALARDDYTVMGGQNPYWRVTQAALSDVGTAFLLSSAARAGMKVGTIAAEEWAARNTPEAAVRAVQASTRGPGAIAGMFGVKARRAPMWAHPQLEPYLPTSLLTAVDDAAASGIPGAIPSTFGLGSDAAAQAFLNNPMLASTYHLAPTGWKGWYAVRNWAATPYRYAPVRVAGEAANEAMKFGWKARATATVAGMGPETESATLSSSIQNEHTIDSINASIARNTGVAAYALDLNNFAMLLHAPLQTVGKTTKTGASLRAAMASADETTNKWFSNMGLPQAWEDFMRGVQKHVKTAYGDDAWSGSYKWEYLVNEVGGEERARRWVTYKLDDYAVSAKARRMLDAETTRVLQEAPSEGAAEATMRVFDQDVLAAKIAEPWSDEEQDALRYFMLRIQRDPELLAEAYHEALGGYRQKDFVNWLVDDYKRNVILGRGRGAVTATDTGNMQNFWNGVNEYLDASEIMTHDVMPLIRGVQNNDLHLRSGIASVAMNFSHSELALRENLDTANSVLGRSIDDVANSIEAAYDDATGMVREAQRTHNAELRNAGRGRQAEVRNIIDTELQPLVDEYKQARKAQREATRKRKRLETSVASRPPEEVGVSLGPDEGPAFRRAVDDAVAAEKRRLRTNRKQIESQAASDYIRSVEEQAVAQAQAQYGGELIPAVEESVRQRARQGIDPNELARVRKRASRMTKEARQRVERRVKNEWISRPGESAHQTVYYAQQDEMAAAARVQEAEARIRDLAKKYELQFNPESRNPLGTTAELQTQIRPVVDDAVTQALETQAPSALAPESAQAAMEARWNWRDAAEARDAGVDMAGVPTVAVSDTNYGPVFSSTTPLAGPPIPELAPAVAQVRSAYDAANAHAMVTRDNERALASLGGWVETVSGETDPMHYGIANKSSLDKVEANERIAEFTGRYDDMMTRQRAAETVMQDADEMFPDFGDAQLDADRAAYIEDTLAAAPTADDWAQFEEDWRTFGLEHFGVGPETVRAWAADGWSRVAEEFTKRANKLAYPIVVNTAEAPAALVRAVERLDELGYKLVTGRGMGHRFVTELPQDALNWERRKRLARLADSIGLNPKIIRNKDIGTVQRANMARRLQAWLDATPEAWRPGMDAKSLMMLIEKLKAGEMPLVEPTRGQKLRAGVRTATAGVKRGEEQWVDTMSGVQRSWSERASAMSKQFTRTVQHRDIPRKQVVQMLTDARVFERFFGQGFAPLTKTQANEVYREIVRAYADTPARMAGAPILDDLFRASATWVGGNWTAAGTVAGAGAGGIGGAVVAATQDEADWADVARGAATGVAAGALAGAGATVAGKAMGRNIGEGLSWAVANMPNKFKQLTSVSRFELSPMFSLRRVTKANLKLSLEGVTPVWRPMRWVASDMEPVTLASGKTTRSLRKIQEAARRGDPAAVRAVEQAELRVKHANDLVLRAFPEYDQVSFQIVDDADRYLREQDVFSLYNGASYEAYAAYQFDKMGHSTEEIRELLIHCFNYGKGAEVGRSAAERTANFVFFPFSFDKTLYRNLGGYLLDRPAQMAFLVNALGAYHWFSNRYPDTPGAAEWLDDHMPILEEVAKLNAFSHGFGFGEVGGINAPILQLFIPHKWRANDRHSLDMLKRFVPVMKDFQNIWERSWEQGTIGYRAGQNASLWMQKAFGGKDWLLDTPAHMYKSTETADVQIRKAYEWRQRLYTEYKDILEWNAKNARNPDQQIVFGNQERFGTYANAPITKNALMNIIKDKYPLFDPTGGSKKMIDGANSIDRYLRDESPGGRNNPNYERIAEWVSNARRYGRYLQDYNDEDPTTDYAWFRGASQLLYQQASWLAKNDSGFYELYRRYFAYTLGPLEEVR